MREYYVRIYGAQVLRLVANQTDQTGSDLPNQLKTRVNQEKWATNLGLDGAFHG